MEPQIDGPQLNKTPRKSIQSYRVDLEADVRPGESYVYTVTGGHYTPVREGGGVGRHVHSGQYQVAYVGLDGPDEGRLFFTPLTDWHLYFKRVHEIAPAEVIEKVIRVKDGNGY